MTLTEFRRSLSRRAPPPQLSAALAGLWWAGKDRWERAHKVVMDENGKDCARVHGYLHRVEGDLENARYWYRRAGVPAPTGTVNAEWAAIARDLLSKVARRPAISSN
jgi:hypothetical protein